MDHPIQSRWQNPVMINKRKFITWYILLIQRRKEFNWDWKVRKIYIWYYGVHYNSNIWETIDLKKILESKQLKPSTDRQSVFSKKKLYMLAMLFLKKWQKIILMVNFSKNVFWQWLKFCVQKIEYAEYERSSHLYRTGVLWTLLKNIAKRWKKLKIHEKIKTILMTTSF